MIIPWSARREVTRRYEGRDAEEIYSEATATLSALADKLRASSGSYLLGEEPTSLDALVFGHLLFYQKSPSAAPALHAAVSENGFHCYL